MVGQSLGCARRISTITKIITYLSFVFMDAKMALQS